MFPLSTKRSTGALAIIAVLALTAPGVQAAPVAFGPASSVSGDGLNANWVRASFSAHSVQSALDVLAATPATGLIQAVNNLAPYIDYRDFTAGTGGHVNSPDLADPFTTIQNGVAQDDPTFAVRFSGYLNVTSADTYQFRIHSDDGFRLNLGGETVAIFDGDRGPADSFSAELALDAGLYAIEFIGWEQGGLYVDELSWKTQAASDFAILGPVDGGQVLFSTVPVPAPGAFVLLASACAGLSVARRRRLGA